MGRLLNLLDELSFDIFFRLPKAQGGGLSLRIWEDFFLRVKKKTPGLLWLIEVIDVYIYLYNLI